MLRPKILYDLPVSLFDLLQALSVLVCNRSMSREEAGMETQIDVRNRGQRGSVQRGHGVPHRLEANPLAAQASRAIDFSTSSQKLENMYTQLRCVPGCIH